MKVVKLVSENSNCKRFQCIHNELSHSEGITFSMAIHLLLTRKQSSMCLGPASHIWTSSPFVQSKSYKDKSRF